MGAGTSRAKLPRGLMTRARRHKLIAAWLVATAAGLGASCNLNPQPLPPGDFSGGESRGGTGNGTSSGGQGAASSGGGSSSGGGLVLGDGGSYAYDDGGTTPKYDAGSRDGEAPPEPPEASTDATPDADGDAPSEGVDGGDAGGEACSDSMPYSSADGEIPE